jgi:hypothetical protein
MLSAIIVNAQTSSDNSQNKPSQNYDGYEFNFKGVTADNCPSKIPYDQYFMSSSYVVNSMGDDTLNLSTDGQQLGWHKLNMRLYDKNCNNITIDLSNNQKFEAKLVSSTSVPQFMVMFADVNGNYANNNPIVKSLTPGVNTIKASDIDFSVYNSNTKIDSTQIAIIALFFRIADTDNDGAGGAAPSVIGNFKIDYVKVGNVFTVSGIANSEIESSLEFFPNPATDKLQVKYSASENCKVLLTDLSGKVIASQDKLSGDTTIVFDTSDLYSGMYLVSIVTEEGIVSRKVSVTGK